MKNPINTSGTVRIVIYVLGALVGLAAVVLPFFGVEGYTGIFTALAGAAAVITGGTATYNVPKADDQKAASLAETLNALLAVVREGQALAQRDQAPDAGDYVGEHRAPEQPFTVL